MSDATSIDVGSLAWVDLTVPDATEVRGFYADVVGWEPGDVDMGGYHDYTMNMRDTKTCVAGVRHARGSNADFPAQWLIYITVADVDASAAKCVERGGELVVLSA